MATQKDIPGKPSALLYYFISLIIYPFAKLILRCKFKKSGIKNLKGPFIVLANHPSSMDPFIIALCMFPYRINFLSASSLFRIPAVSFLLKRIGAIPKVQFSRDTESIRAMISVISRKGIIGILPEGRRSMTGETLPVNISIAKLVKKLKVPVVTVLAKGTYLTLPRWSNYLRPGRIDIEASLILSADDISSMDAESIHRRITDSLYCNDYKWQEIAHVHFHSRKPAMDLQYILHKCPRCLKDAVMSSSNNLLYCTSCGNTAIFNKYCFLEPLDSTCIIFQNPILWNEWQVNEIKKELQQPDFKYKQNTALHIAGRKHGKYKPSGKGVLELTKDEMIYRGSMDGNNVVVVFPLSRISAITANYGLDFEITDNELVYRFIFQNGLFIIKYSHAIELLSEMRGNEILN